MKRTLIRRKIISFIASLALLLQPLSPFVAIASAQVSDDQQPAFSEAPTTPPDSTPQDQPTPEPAAEPTPAPELIPTLTEEPAPTPTIEVTPSPTPIAEDSSPAPPASEPTDKILDGISTQSSTPEVTTDADEQGQLTVAILQNIEAVSLDLASPEAQTSAALSTDKPDYAPTDTVVISGTEFTPNQTYTIIISSDNEPLVHFEAQVQADETGSFIYSFQLDGISRPNYKIEVKDGDTIIASTTFTDPPSPNPASFSISMFGFVLSGTYSVVGGQPTGAGQIKNGNVGAYPEGACIPVELEVKNTGDLPGDAVISPVYDYYNAVVGITDLQSISTGLSGNPRSSATNLNNFNYSGSALTSTTSFNSSSGSISASVSGPYSGNNAGTSATTGTDAQRHYNVTLANVPAGTTVYMILCAKLGLDASQYSGGSSLSVRSAQGGAENVPIPVNQILLLPSITLTKIVDSGTATPDQWSFTVNSQAVYPIPAGQSSVTIDNVSPDGNYSIIESGPGGYNFAGGTGTNCTFNGSTATAAVAAGKPPANASCNFHNTLGQGTIVVHKDVQGPTGQDITDTTQNFTVRLDGSGAQTFTDGGSITYNNVSAGTHTITEDTPPSEYTLFSITPDSDSGTTGAQVTVTAGQPTDVYVVNRQQNATITVIKNVLNPDGGEVADAHQFTVHVGSQSDSIGEGDNAVFNVAPGTYTITEDSDTNYDFVSILPDEDATTGVQVIVEPGEQQTVNVVNRQKKAHITVNKDVVRPDGQTDVSDNHTFTAQLNAANNQSFSENSPYTYGLNPGGPFTVSELDDANYTEMGCRLASGANATNIPLTSNESVSVTCKNAQNSATITVYKDVIKYDGSQTADDNIFEVTLDSLAKNFSENSPAVYSVDPGTYGAVESAEPNYSEYANDGPATVSSNGAATITIVNRQNPLSISGYKYDADGQTGLPGWIINLYSCPNNFGECSFYGTTTTDGSGYYNFGNLVIGLYQASEVLENGWTNLTDLFQNITLNPGVNSTGNNFTNFKLGKITACKYQDANGNGSLDVADDQPLQYIDIKLSKEISSNWSLQDTKATDVNGCVVFDGLSAGLYRVEEDYSDPDLAGYYSSNGITYYDYPVSSGSEYQATFLNALYRIISGQKYNDLNNNGQKDPGEPGLENWTIYIDTNSNDSLDGGEQFVSTDANGNYQFTNLVADYYPIREVLENGWVQTQPTAGYYGADVHFDITSIGNDFGNFLPEPGITNTKTRTSAEEALVGETASFTIVVENTGNVTLYNPVVADTYDADYLGFVSSSPIDPFDHTAAVTDTADYDGDGDTTEMVRTLSWHIPTSLDPGETYTITLTFEALKATDSPQGNTAVTSACTVQGEECPTQNELTTDPSRATVNIDILENLSISKSNDATGTKSPGDSLTYTIKVYNPNNRTIYNVQVTDLLPDGFTYVSGSWTGTSTEPVYSGGKGLWILGDLSGLTTVTLTYKATISGSQLPGIYKDVAYAFGCDNDVNCSTADAGAVLALAIDPGKLDTHFVGTQVEVAKDIQSGSSYNVVGEVLGAAIALPATGAEALWIILALVMAIFGIWLIELGAKSRSKDE